MIALALTLALYAAPSAPPTAWVLDARKISHDERVLAAAAQGIANRAGPIAFLRILPTDDEWVKWYTERFGIQFRPVADVYDFVGHLKPAIRGYILYDPREPETVNLATTIAGLRDAVIATPAVSPGLDRLGLKCLDDLRGRFNNWSRVRIYQWLYDNYAAAAAHDCIANNHGGGIVRLDLTRYLGRGKVFVRLEDATKYDGMGAKFHSLTLLADNRDAVAFDAGSPAEGKYLADGDASWFDPDGDRIADNNQHFTYALDLPRDAKSLALLVTISNGYEILLADSEAGPYESVAKAEGVVAPFGINFLDYCVYRKAVSLELSSIPADRDEYALKTRFYQGLKPFSQVFSWTADEGIEVAHTSRNALLMICCDATNFSFHASVKTDYKFHQPPPPHRATLDPKKVYLTFSLSDGDALHWLARFHGEQWFLPERGQIPFGWEMQPLMATMAPAMAQYFYEKATPNDYMVAAASGAGYVHIEELPPGRLAEYVRLTREYVQKMDERVIVVLSAQNVGPDVISAYAKELGDSVIGCQEGYAWRDAGWFLDHSLAWARSLVFTFPNKPRDAALQELKDLAATHPQRPLFIPYHLFCYSQTIADAKWWADNLPPDFEVLRPDEFFRLQREAMAGTVQLSDVPTSILAPEGAPVELVAPVRNNDSRARLATVTLVDPTGKDRASAEVAAQPWTTSPARLKLTGLTDADAGKWTVRLDAAPSKEEQGLAVRVASLPPEYAGRPVEPVFVKAGTDMPGLAGKSEADPASTTGLARHVAMADLTAPTHPIFGPYMPLPAGDYVAVFLLRATGDAAPDTEVALVDVAGSPQGHVAYGSKTLTLADLAGARYRPVVIPFHVEKSEAALETRVYDPGKADLWIDQVAIFRFPRK